MLWVVRHAAAEHTFGVSDFDRSLRPKGRRQVERMQRWLGNRATPCVELLPPPVTGALNSSGLKARSVVVSSAAKRAVETAQCVKRGLGLSDDALHTDRTLYGAGPATLIGALRQLPPGTRNVALVGHNPGVSDLVEVLIGSSFPDLPTCGIAMLTCPAPWGDLLPGVAELVSVATPDTFSTT